MKSGSASIERHDETHAPHWMQAIDWVMSIIDSGGTMYSRSGGSPSGSSQGVTRRIFVQWVDSMSVTRSLITGMFPIGSTTIGSASTRSLRAPLVRSPLLRLAKSFASPIIVLQARPDSPLIFIPQEPQIAARHEQRTASEPSRGPSPEQAVENGERRIEVDVEALPIGALATLGLEAPHLERELRHA
jgi:hypothetical protein